MDYLHKWVRKKGKVTKKASIPRVTTQEMWHTPQTSRALPVVAPSRSSTRSYALLPPQTRNESYRRRKPSGKLCRPMLTILDNLRPKNRGVLKIIFCQFFFKSSPFLK